MFACVPVFLGVVPRVCCIHVCVGQRSTLGVFFHLLSPLDFEPGSLTEYGACHLAVLDC